MGVQPGRITPLSILACCAVVVVTFVVVGPMFNGTHCGSSDCQSNMKQLGTALRMYATDNHDMYPTNRRFLPNGKLGPVSARVKLTPVDATDKNGKPLHFRYGVNWVEALTPYMEAITKESAVAYRCKAASDAAFPENSQTARVTYVMNRNIMERPEQCVRESGSLMALREVDRLVDAELRPTNYSCGRPDLPPDSPFLTKHDSRIGATNPIRHGQGSHILFADGHVKRFTPDYFPDRITRTNCWDPKTEQWWNIISSSPISKSIAITP